MRVIVNIPYSITYQAGSDEAEEFDITSDAMKKLVNSKPKAATSPNTSELDHFMVLQWLINTFFY